MLDTLVDLDYVLIEDWLFKAPADRLVVEDDGYIPTRTVVY